MAGRDLTWVETYNLTPVVLISENPAREWWREPQAALGKRIRSNTKGEWFEVVGVLEDLRDEGVDHRAPAVVYWPLLMKNPNGGASRVERGVVFLIRTSRAGSTTLLREIREAVWSVNPDLPLANVRTLQAIHDRMLVRTSFTLLLLAIAGAMALVLSVVGIYGVISYSVAERTREIGIRLALGAAAQSVAAGFLRQGLVLSLIGAASGLLAALALTRIMRPLLYEVSPGDPVTFGAVSVGLVLAAAVASYLPARRAARVDPSEALRAE